MDTTTRRFAIVTGASTGIGLELARQCRDNGFDLLIAADEGPELETAAASLRAEGITIETVIADLSGPEGVDQLCAAVRGRTVDALMANAGRGLGHGFLDQDTADWRHVVDTNITGTLLLVHKVGQAMRTAGAGRILITGSIAGFMPGTFQAVYNGTKAFLDSFSVALRHELKDSGVTVTCLMPGVTATEFFERGNLMDTDVGSTSQEKGADPAKVAKDGFDAMMSGDEQVVSGWKNKLQAAAAHVLPASVTAEMHRSMAEPGSAKT